MWRCGGASNEDAGIAAIAADGEGRGLTLGTGGILPRHLPLSASMRYLQLTPEGTCFPQAMSPKIGALPAPSVLLLEPLRARLYGLLHPHGTSIAEWRVHAAAGRGGLVAEEVEVLAECTPMVTMTRSRRYVAADERAGMAP